MSTTKHIEAVTAAYLRQTRGQTVTRARMAHVRIASGLSRESFDAAVAALLKNGTAAVYPMDDPRERTIEDVRGAYVYSGVPQHIMILRYR